MRDEPKTCGYRNCVLYPSQGEWCYYHAKIATGTCDPASPLSYQKKMLEDAQRAEMARLRAEVALGFDIETTPV